MTRPGEIHRPNLSPALRFPLFHARTTAREPRARPLVQQRVAGVPVDLHSSLSHPFSTSCCELCLPLGTEIHSRLYIIRRGTILRRPIAPAFRAAPQIHGVSPTPIHRLNAGWKPHNATRQRTRTHGRLIKPQWQPLPMQRFTPSYPRSVAFPFRVFALPLVFRERQLSTRIVVLRYIGSIVLNLWTIRMPNFKEK